MISSRLQSHRKIKCCSLIDRGLGPDAPAVAVENTLDDRQSHSSPLVILGAVKSLEHTKEFMDILHIKADAIVFDEIGAVAVQGVAADLNAGYLPLARKFERVREE